MTNEAHEKELPPGTDKFEESKAESSEPMTTEVSFDEFRSTGLLVLANQFLHIFGFAIGGVYDDDGVFERICIMRVKFRGFSENSTTKAYTKVSEYLVKNSQTLLDEAKS